MKKTAAKIRKANLLTDENGLSGYQKTSQKCVQKFVNQMRALGADGKGV